MSLLKQMHPNWQFDSYEEYELLKTLISEQISERAIEEIPVTKRNPMTSVENWYRDKASGEIYSLVPPDFPARGQWIRLDYDDIGR